MKIGILVVASTLMVLAAADVGAAEQPQAPAVETPSGAPATALRQPPQVTITAPRGELAPRVDSFVNQITVEDPDDSIGLARWLLPVCPLVTGLPQQQGEFVLGRVSQIARAAGVPIAGEKCRPNLYIFVTDKPAELLRGMEQRNRIFTFADAPPNLIDEFISTNRPVRVWYHTEEKTPEGLPLTSLSFPELGKQNYRDGDPPIKLTPGSTDASGRANLWANSSHIIGNFIWDIHRVFVIVDTTRLKGVSRGQFADYVAMVGLAQVQPDNRLGDAQTILTLFAGAPQAASPGLSAWDEAFLKSLYETDQRSKNQRSLIARSMVRTLAP
jgi:hypothetical protein